VFEVNPTTDEETVLYSFSYYPDGENHYGDDAEAMLCLDNNRQIKLDPNEHLHLDHGYAVTNHSCQGAYRRTRSRSR
jgi:hypothetical protein